MPPASNVRGETKRTASGRAVRANTTRPMNYYARPFGPLGGATAAGLADQDAHDAASPGFFSALQFFSDAVTALPREVIKQFTQMKEVEAKIHAHHQKMGEAVDALMNLDIPPRRSHTGHATAGGQQQQQQQQSLLSFTASNSINGSANASLINGYPGGQVHSTQGSVSGSVAGEDAAIYETEEELARRKQYLDLRILTHNLLPILDEKNVVLAEANRVLSQQLVRVDSVLPHLDNEISEEARLGSMTHWAYSDNRQKKGASTAAVHASRRDVAAANSLAAAASAIHETEIAQARRDAGREAAKDKPGKGKRAAEHFDSDFDERPKKTHAKVAKSKAAGQPLIGLGIANGEPAKKRRMDKGVVAPAMERSLSAATKATKASRETPRSTPTAEPKKGIKKPPPTKPKRAAASIQNSPALVSSPLHSSFVASSMEPPPGARPQSARLRQNSTATNLRHEKTIDEDGSRPPSAAGVKSNGKANGKRKSPQNETADKDSKTAEDNELKREEANAQDSIERPVVSRTASSNGKGPGRSSKTGTPRTEDAAAMARTRSTRSQRGNARDDSSSEPQTQGRHHQRHTSNSHILKQLAPFNRSPDIDRHRGSDSSSDEDDEQDDEEGRGRRTRGRRSNPTSRPGSRRRTEPDLNAGLSTTPAVNSPAVKAAVDVDAEDEDEAEREDTRIPDAAPASPSLPPPDAPALEADHEIEDEDDDEQDPDDPNADKYCYCNRGSYGEMVACDNEGCAREWFHIGCTELEEAPGEDEVWYCDQCRPLFVKKGGRGAKGKGR
ncbi:PHD zinc finger protein [Teratosphaeria destructans]|uniref:Chromatin modification-related protein n=1 Tax=Teratosphaeria destructans TaxID=418781 RepID=A0A9W7W550_9PEZI|nr:PHD zinc finger protein [Teratosphaeria destructans]